MSFAKEQTDYFGLGSNSIICVSSDENKSAQVAQARNEKGDVVAQEIYGEMMSPSCSYVLKADGEISTQRLGDVSTSGTKKFTLTSLSIDTSAGSPPSITASGEEVPQTSHNDCYYTIPSATIEVCHHAQILWSAFTLSGSGCYLTQASYTASCGLTKATKDGETIAYDVTDGVLEVSITIVQSDDAEPSITAGTDWEITGPLSCSNPDADYPTWTATLTMNLSHASTSSAS